MHIQREIPDKHAIRGYTPTSVHIDEKNYDHSIAVSSQTLIDPWPVTGITHLSLNNLEPLLALNPEVLILAHAEQSPALLPVAIMEALSKQRIGVEVMSLGAACRTFNVLLSEKRRVVLGIIFK